MGPRWVPLRGDETIMLPTMATPEETADVLAAVEAWNRAVGTTLKASSAPSAHVVVLSMVPRVADTLCLEDGCRIRIRSISTQLDSVLLPRSEFRIAMLHELGHALGLDHSERGIMRSPLWLVECLDTETSGAWLALRGLSRPTQPVCMQ